MLLIELALFVLFNPTSLYSIISKDPNDNRLLSKKLTHCWIQQFINIYHIVLLIQRDWLTCNPRIELQIKMQIAHHLNVLHRGF